MNTNATIKDVARLAGVSTATVSLVVNQKEGVKPETRERVLAAVRQMNYTPNASARQLIDRKSHTIGLVVTDVMNPFFGAIVSAIHQCVQARGYQLSIGLSNDSVVAERSCVKRFQEERVEGIIVIPSVQRDSSLDFAEYASAVSWSGRSAA